MLLQAIQPCLPRQTSKAQPHVDQEDRIITLEDWYAKECSPLGSLLLDAVMMTGWMARIHANDKKSTPVNKLRFNVALELASELHLASSTSNSGGSVGISVLA